MSTLTEFKNNKIKIKEAKQAAKDLFKKVFAECSSEVFNKFPTLVSFGWTQYTPYFNDGEPCTFSANYSYPSMTFLTDGVEEEFDENSGDEPEDPQTTEDLRKKASDYLDKFFENFDEDGLEDFGEGKVVVTRDGKIDVEDYDHD